MDTLDKDNDSRNLIEYSFLKEFLQRKLLTMINSEIYLCNVTFDLFTNLQGNLTNQNFISFITFMLYNIIEKTECTTTLNIIFRSDIDLDKVPFKNYERIFFYFYSSATLTKYIENKKFYVCFPKLKNKLTFNLIEEIKSKLSEGNETFLIDIFNTNPLCEKLLAVIENNKKIENIDKKKFYYIEKNQYENYLNSNNNSNMNKISNKFILEEMFKIDNCLSSTSDDLLLFAFDEVALGGSFDHYHMGHNMLLNTAALLSKKSVKVGVTSNEMVHKKAKCCLVQSYSTREANVRISLDKLGGISHTDIFPLNDPVGQAGTNSSIQALIVTNETIKGGHFVNEIRKKNNLNELQLIIANIILDCNNIPKNVNENLKKDNNKFLSQDLSKISSTSIRKKVLDDISLEHLECLEKLWVKLTLNILKCSPDISSNWFTTIRDLYMQSWRKYHTLNHIYTFVTNADNYFKLGFITDYVNVLLAVWFHDIIYTPSRPDNEERSCEKFMQFFENIKRGLVIENTIDLINPEKVLKYIMATKYHFSNETYEDRDLNFLLDLDLFSLGEPDFERYIEITKTIKFEFTHHLSETEWIQGRSKFLETVINKEFIYRTQELRNKLEVNAKGNVCKELELLLI